MFPFGGLFVGMGVLWLFTLKISSGCTFCIGCQSFCVILWPRNILTKFPGISLHVYVDLQTVMYHDVTATSLYWLSLIEGSMACSLLCQNKTGLTIDHQLIDKLHGLRCYRSEELGEGVSEWLVFHFQLLDSFQSKRLWVGDIFMLPEPCAVQYPFVQRRGGK